MAEVLAPTLTTGGETTLKYVERFYRNLSRAFEDMSNGTTGDDPQVMNVSSNVWVVDNQRHCTYCSCIKDLLPARTWLLRLLRPRARQYPSLHYLQSNSSLSKATERGCGRTCRIRRGWSKVKVHRSENDLRVV